MSRTSLSAGSVLFCVLPFVAHGQAERVEDINTSGAGSSPYGFFRLASSTFFIANDGEHGEELWVKPDGSDARLVKDVNPGPSDSSPSSFAAIGTELFFSAATAEHGRELWKTDGTEAGTVMVADIYPGADGSGPQQLTPYGGYIVFTARDAEHGNELWRTDGSEATLILDIEPGAESSNPLWLLEVPNETGGSMLIFAAATSTDGSEPWKTEGTAETTERLWNLTAGSGSSFPADFAVLSDRWVFFRASPSSGGELWQYEPATDVAASRPVGTFGSAFPMGLTEFDGHLYFAAFDSTTGMELWRTDGMSDPVLVDDILPGSDGSNPRDLVVAGGTLFFSAEHPTAGRELWYLEDSAATPQLVADANPGAADGGLVQITATTAALFYGANGALGTELWMAPADAPATAALVKDIWPGTGQGMSGEIAVDGTGVTFRGDDGVHGGEPWHSDGTEAGTSMLADINLATASASPGRFVAFRGETYFVATDDEHGAELMAFDGETIRLVKDINTGIGDANPRQLTVVGDTLFFAASDGVHGFELWKTDGTAAGTVLVSDINPGSGGSALDELFAFGSQLLFEADDGIHDSELWISDGTEAGTQMILDMNPAGGSSPRSFVELDGVVYFAASDGFGATYGREVWKTDGTAAGTTIAIDMVPGSDGSAPNYLTVVDGALYFTYETVDGDGRLAKSDGTPAGTTTIADPDPASNEDQIDELTWLPDLGLFAFLGSTDANGDEPWVSDGTAAGTRMLMDINPGPAGSRPGGWTVLDGVLYFGAEDDAGGNELWRYTPGGVAERVIDANAGAGDGLPGELSSALTTFGGKLFLAASTDGVEFELWRSDGTAAGTTLFQDINAHEGAGSDPGDFFAAGDYLLFAADDGDSGVELWKLDLADVDAGAGDGDGNSDGDGNGDGNDSPPPSGGDNHPPTSGGGGGGAMSWFTLAALLTLASRRRRAGPRTARPS